jgi:hypothetical protein
MRYFVIALLVITPFLLILRSRIRLLNKTKKSKDENGDQKNKAGKSKFINGDEFDEF